MIYTEFDIKLLRHALDTNSEGEAGNAAAMFFKELRKRGVKAHEFMETKGETPQCVPAGWNPSDWKIEFERRVKSVSDQALQIMRERDQALGDVSRACTRAADEYSKRGFAERNLWRCQEQLVKCQEELARTRKKKGN
jgi:hypothetical protein